AKNVQKPRAFGEILRHQCNGHAQLREGLASQREKRGGRIQLTADGFSDGQTGAHALGAAIQVVQRDGLLQVFAEQKREVVLCNAEKFLLALQTGGQRLDAGVEFVIARRVLDDLHSLRGKKLQRINRRLVWAQTIGGFVQADQSQRVARRILKRNQQEVVRVPGILFGRRRGIMTGIRIMNFRREHGSLIGGDEIGAPDFELGPRQLLETRKRLFASQQLVQCFLWDAHPHYASKQTGVRLIQTDEDHAEGR